MKFRLVLEFDPETNGYSAICPELPGCASAGDTEDEARANIEEAIRLYLAPAEISLPGTAKMSEVTLLRKPFNRVRFPVIMESG
jgi:predicted RNase H-like HicB family nuclease